MYIYIKIREITFMTPTLQNLFNQEGGGDRNYKKNIKIKKLQKIYKRLKFLPSMEKPVQGHSSEKRKNKKWMNE